MPPQIADWPEVKATAIATGSLLEAAEVHKVNYEAVRQRASREDWPVGRRVHKQAQDAQNAAHQQIIRVSQGNVTSVTSASQALQSILSDDERETRISLSRAARKMAKQAEVADITEAGDALQVGKLASLVHRWERDRDGDRVSLAFFSISIGSGEPEAPTVDVEAEVVREDTQAE